MDFYRASDNQLVASKDGWDTSGSPGGSAPNPAKGGCLQWLIPNAPDQTCWWQVMNGYLAGTGGTQYYAKLFHGTEILHHWVGASASDPAGYYETKATKWSAGVTTPVSPAVYTPGIPDGMGGYCTCQYQSLLADPVNTATGMVTESVTDVAVPGVGVPFAVSRSYRSDATVSDGLLGKGWSLPFESKLAVVSDKVTLSDADGARVVFVKNPDGSYATPKPVRYTLATVSGGFTVTALDHTSRSFDATGLLTGMVDSDGRGLALGYTAGRLSKVTDAAGRTATLTVDPATGRLSQVALQDGRKVGYGYTAGQLTKVTGTDGGVTQYSYVGGRLATVVDPNANTITQNTYDATTGRIVKQIDADNKTLTFAWIPEAGAPSGSGRSEMTDALGGVWTDEYQAGVLMNHRDPLWHGSRRTYDDKLNITEVSDANFTRSSMTYDAHGNVATAVVEGTTEKWEYDTSDRLSTHTDGRGHVTTYTYFGSSARVKTVTAPAGVTSYTYTPTGQVETVTTPEGHLTRYGYDAGGRQNSVTTPEGNQTTSTFGDAGRITSRTDPRGNVTGADKAKYTTLFEYDAAGRLWKQTDPAGHVTTTLYDANGNVKKVADALGHDTTFEYDVFNRPKKVTGPDGKFRTTTYDTSGNKTSTVDETGGTTTYTYDKGNRLASTTTPRGNVKDADPAKFTTTYGYDGNGNRTQVVDPTGAQTTTEYDAFGRVKKVTDPLGQFTSTTYDDDGNVATTTDALGKVTTSTYTASDLLETVTDPLKKVTSYGYDHDGNRTSQTTPLGFKTTWTFDADGRTATQVDPRGNASGADPAQFTTTYDYDAAGNATKVTDPLGKSTVTSYNTLGQVETVTDPLGHVIRTGYDELGRIKKVTGPDGADTNYTYNVSGTLATRTDPGGHPTTYEYDDAGRQKSVTDPLGRKQSFGYDPDGNRTTVTNARGVTATSTIDARGLPTAVSYTDATAPVATTYDAAGRRKTVTDATGTRTFGYDPAGRLKSAAPEHGGAFSYGYDDAGHLTSRTYPDGRTYAYGYDADGRQSSMSTPGSVTAGTLDPSKLQGIAIAGDGTQTHAVAVADGKVWYAQQKADGTWPAFEDLAPKTGSKPAVSAVAAAWVNGGLQVTMVSGGKLWHSVRNTDGTWTVWGDVFAAVGGSLTNLTYSSLTSTTSGLEMVVIADGKLWHAIRKPDGHWTVWGDVFGAVGSTLANPSRITVAATPSGLELVAIAGGKLWHTVRKSDGHWTAWGDVFGAVHGTLTDPTRVTVAPTASGLEVLTVASGKLWHAVRKPDATWTTWGDVFGAAGTLAGLTEATATPAGTDLKVLAGATGLIGYTKRATNGTWIKPWQTAAAGPAPAVTTYGYDAAGNLTSTTLPAANGYTEQRGYDRDGRLTAIGSTKAGSPLANWQLTLDDGGQPTRIDGTRAGQPNASQYYTYDPAGRLLTECTAATQAATCPTPATATTYTYDGSGNRKTQTTPTAATTYTYDDADQLSSAVTGTTTRAFTYDADGNQTGTGSDTLTYDANNRLTQATTGGDSYTFTYDADGNRTTASKAGTLQRTTAWDLNNALPQIATETNASGALIADYAYNPLEQIQSQQTAADTFTYHHDALGSVTDLTSSTGVNQYRNSYTAYGEQTQAKLVTTAPADPFGYTGQYKESTPTSAGYNLRARNYDPTIGRFTGRDPMDQGQNTPYSAAYGYVENAATTRIDPSGMCSTKAKLKDALTGNFGWNNNCAKEDRAAAAADSNPNTAGVKQTVDAATDLILANAEQAGAGYLDGLSFGLLPMLDPNFPRACTPGYTIGQYGAMLPIFGGGMGRAPAELGTFALRSEALIPKAVNLPAWKTVAIDMVHIIKNHTANGSVYRQSGIKTKFPDFMSPAEIEATVRQAYRFATMAGPSQGTRVYLRGFANGLVIEMWVDRATSLIETAFPVWR